MQAWSDSDPREKVTDWLAKVKGMIPGAALIIMGDSVGIGLYFLRHLADKGHDVRMFNAGGAPIHPEHYANAKAEAYFTLREWMRDGFVHGIEDEDTKAQLADIRYRETTRGRIEIEHKDEARARGSSSPDRAEALILAFVKVVPRQQRYVFSGGVLSESQWG
jgi:carbamoylphosphate synthase small subunit